MFLTLNTDKASSEISQCLFDTIVSFRSYNRYGKPVELDIKGMPVTYLWAYQGEYPIAEIKGMTEKEVKTLFKKGLDPRLRKVLDKGRTSSSSVKINADLLLDKNVTGRDLTNIRQVLDEYNGFYPIATTTCIYKPLVGVTEMTDPTGLRTEFQYDTAGRLIKTIRACKGLLGGYQYHYAGSNGEQNYVCSSEYLNADGTDSIFTVQYYDAWGRPSLTKTVGANTAGTPLFGLLTYDRMGRPDKTWTPFPSSSDVTVEDFASASAAAFGDPYGYSETSYDALGRTSKVTTPGRAWRERPSVTEYSTNGAQEVKLYTITGNRMNKDGYYPAGTLSCTQTKDPDGIMVRTYKDLFGNVVLERRDLDNDTYYVYDDRNHLRYVLQPQYQKVQDLSKFAFYYAYNGRGLVIEKKLPGCETVRYWYDGADRLKKMQDGLLAAQGKYRVYTYNILNQLKKQSVSEGNLIIYDEIENYYNNYIYDFDNYAGTTLLDGLLNSLTVTGNEEFVQNWSLEDTGVKDLHGGYDQFLYKTAPVRFALNQLTGSRSRTSDGGEVFSLYAYDEQNRLSRSEEVGINGHVMLTDQAYNYFDAITEETIRDYAVAEWETTNQLVAGRLIISAKMQEHIYMLFSPYRDDSVRFEREAFVLKRQVSTENKYDIPHTKLLGSSVITMRDIVNGQTMRDTISRFTYDEFGKMVANDRSGTAGDMSYMYDNLHGWLTNMESAGGFRQNLYRETGAAKPRFNGSIAAMTWNVGDYVDRTYNYTCDGLNRLVSANYSSTINASGSAAADPEHRGLLPWDCLEENYSESFSYDKNSNIDYIERMGTTNTRKGQEIDVLIMEYDGNQLKNVCDFSGESLTYSGAFDFVDRDDMAQEYDYNENGAMTKDVNKGITNIEYDLLGNPRRVTFEDRNSIEYVYAADGRKLKTVHSSALKKRVIPIGNGGRVAGYKYVYIRDTTDYINNYVFKNGVPEMYRFGGGYYSFDGQGQLADCHFYVQDYQGNNRMVVNAYADTVEQVNHYYSYGALMGDISTNEDEQKYKYGDKELDRKFGLDLNDFEARQQDPLVGRFTSIDPMAEKYYSISPYAYCAGDPINLIDPSGMSWYQNDETGNYTWFNDEDMKKHERDGYTYIGEEGSLCGELEAQIDELFKAQWHDDKRGLGLYEDGTIVNVNNSTSFNVFDMYDWLEEFKSGNGPEIRILTNPAHFYSMQLAMDKNVQEKQKLVKQSGQKEKGQSKQWMPWDHLSKGIIMPIMNFVGTFDFMVYPSGRTIACDRKSVYSYFYHLPGSRKMNHNRSSFPIYGNTYQFYVIK
ncbi:MAG: RHS repeat-associated core domain-containing protein [Bacteroidales bacterium]|nr:RHS repeat-associated core domain-containing protein [Bacteroidales bacterium]